MLDIISLIGRATILYFSLTLQNIVYNISYKAPYHRYYPIVREILYKIILVEGENKWWEKLDSWNKKGKCSDKLVSTCTFVLVLNVHT